MFPSYVRPQRTKSEKVKNLPFTLVRFFADRVTFCFPFPTIFFLPLLVGT